MSQSFLQSDFLKVVLDGVIGLVNGLNKLIDTFGAFPTLLAGFSAFKSLKGGGIFKIFNADLDGATKKLGIFNKTFTELKDAFNSGKSGNTDGSKGFFGGLKSMLDSLKSPISETDIAAIKAYNAEIANGVDAQTAIKNTMNGTSVAARGLVEGANGGQVALSGLKTQTIGATVAMTALNTAVGMGVGLLISLAISGITKLINADKELAEEVDELTSKFKEQHDELKKLQKDYDTSDENSMISKYEKLSKGVDHLGRNVSLTADEYSEYQSIVNQIADQIPSLITGYDSQGNALLSCKDNVEELTKAYEDLIAAQNREILTNAGDIEKNFKNAVEDINFAGVWGTKMNSTTIKKLEEIYNNPQSDAYKQINSKDGQMPNIFTWLEDPSKFKEQYNSMYENWQIASALEKSGYDMPWYSYLPFWGDESVQDALKDVAETDPEILKNIIEDYYGSLDEYVEEMKTIGQATLSNAFDISTSDYYNMSDDLKSVANQIVNSFDDDFLIELQSKGITVREYTNDMLSSLNALSKENVGDIETAFDLQTQFNGGEISYGEYINGLKDAESLIDGLNLDDKTKEQFKISLGLDENGLLDQYEALKNKLANSEKFNIMPSEYERFLNNLSQEELQVAIDIITEFEETDYKESIADIEAELRRQMIIQGLTFELDLEVETAGIDALNTAMAESVSATGLSSDSIAALKSRYADLEAQGYDLTSMFEETSNGIHLNRQEFNKLEKAYASQKLAKIDGELKEMKDTYDLLGEEIRNCDDVTKKSELYNDRITLAQKISEAATLAAQYEGLTSAYNAWQNAESAGQERDMYENVISGIENIDDEISRGWVDDGTIELLNLLTGKDYSTAPIEDIEKAYEKLDKKINKAGYSVRDFFTVDEDGNSTNTGVYNFLETVEALEDSDKYIKKAKELGFEISDLVETKNGEIVGFDFNVIGGDEAVAEALGISEELVQIILRAADDAGFVISLDGTYKNLAELQNEAKTASSYLKEIGLTDYEFDFNTANIEDLNEQLNEAHKILDNPDFWNADGTFNFKADGATEAMTVVSMLQAKLDNLKSEQYGIGLTVEDEEFEEPLENLQEYGRTIATLNQLKLDPEVNAEDIKVLEARLEEIAQEFNELPDEKKIELGIVGEKGKALTEEYFDSLPDEKKIELGFVDEDGKPLTEVTDAIQKKIESGEITIPTVLDIQANMDKNIETLADLALLNSGLLSSDEEEVIRKKYKIEAEVSNDDAKKEVENKTREITDGSGEKTREENIKIIAETTGVKDVNDLSSKLEGLDDKQIEAVVDVLGQIDVDKLKVTMATLEPKKVEAIVEAIGKGDVDGLKYAIKQLEPKQVQAIAEALGYDDVNELIGAIDNLDPKVVKAVAEALGITDVNSLIAVINNLNGKEVFAKVNTDGQADKIDSLQSKISGLIGKTVDVVVNYVKSGWNTVNGWFGGGDNGEGAGVDGTAHVNGTAFANGTTGRAFKQGSWGTKSSGTALGGELGTELLVRNGRWYTIGEKGAEFFGYKKDDIIFNADQTRELFEKGKITHGNGRGKALASGTAFSSGTGGGLGKVMTSVTIRGGSPSSSKNKNNKKSESSKKSGRNLTIKNETTVEDNSGSYGTSGGSGKNENGTAVNGGNKTKENQDKFEETFDWIEIAISRIERAIDKLDLKASSIYRSWSERNKALADEISTVGEEIELQESAAARYLKEANSVGLSESYAQKVRDGSISIEDFEGEDDEELVEKIKNYQKWYELYLECIDAAEQLREEEAKLYAQRFEDVQSEYDGILQGFEHTESMLNEYISQAEASGHIVSKKYYEALIDNEKSNIAQLKKEQSNLLDARQEYYDAMIAQGMTDAEIHDSQQWYEMCAEIDGVTQAIEEGITALIEYDNAMRDIDWQVFDLIQERISDVTEEADFLIELMSNKKLFEDDGKLTSQGLATLGLHGQNYNTYMYQADEYGNEITKLDAQIAEDPYDQELINRRQELLELQRESILAAEDEKNAIKSLIEEGIQLELDNLSDLIDEYENALDSQKD